ncbi:kappaPI-actitoxin-Avd3b-like [Clavelina lepadiformis]|uniref:kappaPI-actitoxin-Avd3b-like n=1 Tax=Clavelina lepadiformis TaxID=159417 RepID=UPI00404256BB
MGKGLILMLAVTILLAGVADLVLGNEDCNLPSKMGRCKGYHIRWFYNSEAASCQVFVYGGCRGNNNNFKTQEECERVCGN